ncbi:hypothetical protein [Flaviaesturariibacter amylovorans]|uniref:T9SS type A sorting domain-containing protein n=1 Tax=Flaviaesturariibacter amylovorans TaxID=1084520 RepID=A0ABP8GW24_9BACT
MKRILLSVLGLSVMLTTSAQQLTNKGSLITIPSGNTVTVVGSISTSSNGAISNNGNLQTTGDWSHDGTLLYSGTGTLELNGSGAQTLTGTTLYNLLVSGSGTKTTSGTSTVSNSLLFSGTGILNTTTNSDTLELGSSATISETAAAYLDGWIRTTRTLSQGVSNSFGGLGITLTANGSAPGVTTAKRGTGITAVQTGSGNLGIARVFNVTPATNNGLNADVVFAYRDGELNSLSEASLVLFRSTDGGSSWTYLGQVARDASANTLTMSGLNSFGQLTLGSSATPLPLTWLSFTGIANTTGNLLQWTTANESNTSHFEVERSADGSSFQGIGRVGAAGNSSTDRRYSFTDGVTGGTYYYRLKQVDNDGRYSYSSVVRLARGEDARAMTASAYPVPFQDKLTLRLSKAFSGNTKLILSLMDATGKTVLRKEATMGAGQVDLPLSGLGALPKGSYYLQGTAAGGEHFLLKLAH